MPIYGYVHLFEDPDDFCLWWCPSLYVGCDETLFSPLNCLCTQCRDASGMDCDSYQCVDLRRREVISESSVDQTFAWISTKGRSMLPCLLQFRGFLLLSLCVAPGTMLEVLLCEVLIWAVNLTLVMGVAYIWKPWSYEWSMLTSSTRKIRTLRLVAGASARSSFYFSSSPCQVELRMSFF